jgi:hypothetical protein
MQFATLSDVIVCEIEMKAVQLAREITHRVNWLVCVLDVGLLRRVGLAICEIGIGVKCPVSLCLYKCYDPLPSACTARDVNVIMRFILYHVCPLHTYIP